MSSLEKCQLCSNLKALSKQSTPKGPKYFLHSKQGAFANYLIKAFTVVSEKLLVLSDHHDCLGSRLEARTHDDTIFIDVMTSS